MKRVLQRAWLKLCLLLVSFVLVFVGVLCYQRTPVQTFAGGVNIVHGGTVTGERISLNSSGNRESLYYAAFEMDENREIRVDFTGKNMPVIRLMANTVNGNMKNTANDGILVHGDAYNRLGMSDCYMDSSNRVANAALGISSLTVGTDYTLTVSLVHESGVITGAISTLYTRSGETLSEVGSLRLNTTETNIKLDRNETAYVIFMNNVVIGATEFTYHRDSTVTGVSYAEDTSTLSWNRLIGADGYFVKADDGEWIATAETSYLFSDLSNGVHTLSVCANVGGEKGEAVALTAAVGMEDRIIIEEGAYIRTGNLSGMRFSAFVKEDLNGTAGILIHKGSLQSGELISKDNYDIFGYAENFCPQSKLEGYKQFNVVIINIPTENYAQKLCARAFYVDGGTYVYSTDTVERSAAEVASTALTAPEYTGNASLMGYVDAVVEDFTLSGANEIGLVARGEEKIALTVTPKAGLVSADLTALTPVWESSDENILTVSKEGVVTPVAAGNATVRVTLGSRTKEHSVSVLPENKNVSENADGTLSLHGTPESGSPYYMMECGEINLNTVYEVTFQGRNFPAMWMGADKLSGNYKSEGTGMIVTFDSSYGLAVSSKVYGSGRTPIENVSGASGSGWTLDSLNENATHVLRVRFVPSTQGTVKYLLNLYLYEVESDGEMTLLNSRITSSAYENGLEEGKKYYTLLAGNRAKSEIKVSYRTYELMGDAQTTLNAQGIAVLHGTDSSNLPYLATEYRVGDYVEAFFDGGVMPNVRFGWGEVTSNAKTAGNGFILTNGMNTGLSIYHTAFEAAGVSRTPLGSTLGVAAVEGTNATTRHMLRVGLKQAEDGAYKMVAYWYRFGEDGALILLNDVSVSTLSLTYGEDMYVQILGSRQNSSAHPSTAFSWQIKNGDIRELEEKTAFSLYAYSGPSNGIYSVDGVETDVGTNFQTQAEYDAYAASGLNILLMQGEDAWNDTLSQQEHVKEVMAMAVKSGLKVIVHDSRIELLSQSTTPLVGSDCRFATQAALNAKIKEYMDEYSHLEGFYGLQIHDEPVYTMLPALGAVYRAIKAYDEHCYVQCNLLPYDAGAAASYAAGGTSATAEADYISYLNTYLTETGGDYIMFDSYPILPTTVRGYHLRGMQIAANICKARGVDLYNVAQSCAWSSGGEIKRRACEEDDMYWQTNLLMGLGVKDIAYYTYQTKKRSSESDLHIDGSAFMNYDGTKTALYTTMQKIHGEMQLLAPVILQYDYVDMQVYASSTQNWLGGVENAASMQKISSVSGVTSTNEVLFVSEMYNERTGQYGYMILNLSDPGKDVTLSATVTFNVNSVAVYTKGVRELKTLSGGAYGVSLAPGQAVFVVAQ